MAITSTEVLCTILVVLFSEKSEKKEEVIVDLFLSFTRRTVCAVSPSKKRYLGTRFSGCKQKVLWRKNETNWSTSRNMFDLSNLKNPDMLDFSLGSRGASQTPHRCSSIKSHYKG